MLTLLRMLHWRCKAEGQLGQETPPGGRFCNEKTSVYDAVALTSPLVKSFNYGLQAEYAAFWRYVVGVYWI